MRKFFRIASRIMPSNLLIKGIRGTVVAPFYHLVSDNPPPHVKHLYKVLSIKDFEKDLEFLLKHFRFIDSKSLNDLLGSKGINEKPSLFLSFDDGFREAKEVIIPILLKKGVSATFFVNPAHVDNTELMYRCKVSLIVEKIESQGLSKPISLEVLRLLETPNNVHDLKAKLFQLKFNQVDLISSIAETINYDFSEYLHSVKPYLSLTELQDISKLGFTIGGHGFNHPYFSEISFDEQFKEVETCMNWINSHFSDQPKLFAFPFTDFGVSEDLLKKMILSSNNLCDVSFGTSGIQPVRFSRHLQRIPMEDSGISGRDIVRGEILYYLAKKSIGHYKRNNDQD